MKQKQKLPWGAIVGVLAIVLGIATQLWPIFWVGVITVIADPIIHAVKKSRAQKDEMIALLREQNTRQDV